MITWIQTYFQKHFRTIFAVLLGVIIISFVFGINASGGFGRADRQAAARLFFGHNLSNEQETSRFMRDGSYSAQLKGESQADEGSIQQYSLSRVAGLTLADELHLPVPSEKAVAAYIATLPAFQDQQGGFDQKRYSNFADSLKANPQFTTVDANRIFRDDTRLEALNKLIGGPGYVLPADVREMLSRTDAKWSIAIASLDYATFDAGVNTTEEALKKYFDDNSGNYLIGNRAKLSAVLFPSAEFTSSSPLTEEQLRAYFEANRKNYQTPADADGSDLFTKIRPQIEATLRNELATRAAVKAANEFNVALYGKATANSPELAAFLVAQKRSAMALEPYSKDAPPASMPWLSYYDEQVSRLNKEKFFSDPLPTPDGAIVLLWNGTLPSYQPAFAEVREKVATDYKENEKRKRFVAQGQTLRAKLTAALKAGTTFEKAAADAKLEVKSYADFTLQDIPKDMPPAVRQSLGRLKAGEIADMISTADKGHFIYAAQKQLPDLTPANPRFSEIRSRLMAYNASTNGSISLDKLAKAELEKSAPPTVAPAAK